MPLAKYGDLRNVWRIRGDFSLGDARAIMIQIMTAIKHLHSLGIIHRDVKGSNVVFMELDPLVAMRMDFGFSAVAKTAISCVGTEEYSAPEVFWNDDWDRYGPGCDFYFLGVLFIKLLIDPKRLKLPELLPRYYFEWLEDFGNPRELAISSASPELSAASGLAREMVAFNPRDRPSAMDCFSSPWLQNDWSVAPEVVARVLRIQHQPQQASSIASEPGPVQQAQCSSQLFDQRPRDSWSLSVQRPTNLPKNRVLTWVKQLS